MLTRKLPVNIEIGALKYPINSDFRALISFELTMQDNSLTDSEKVDKALRLFYPTVPIMDKAEAVDKLLWFYRCGKEIKENSSNGKAIYSYEHDADYIFDAFLSQYHIDLTEIEYLHWWKFKAMFSGLQDCKFVEIMGYRAMKIDPKMSRSQRDFYRKMKRFYALPDTRSEEQKEIDMINTFIGMF